MKHYVTVDPDIVDDDGALKIVDYWADDSRTPTANDKEIGTTTNQKTHLIFYTTGYKPRSMAWDDPDVVVFNPTIVQRRKIREDQLKIDYNDDVLWTDSPRVFYRKLVDNEVNTASDDTWYGRISAYWLESHNEREENLTDIAAAGDQAALDAITFSPTHVKERHEIESRR